MADAKAHGKADNSPGICSGNVVQLPVDPLSETNANTDTEQANADPVSEPSHANTKRDSFTLEK